MTRRGRVGAVVLALSTAIGSAGCAEIFGDRQLREPEDTLSFDNRRAEVVVVTYETTAEQRESRPLIEEVRLPPGERGLLEVGPLDDGCLVAPVVARTEDGVEVERLPTGYCLGDDLSAPENQVVIR